MHMPLMLTQCMQGADTSLQAGRRRPRQQGRGVHMYEAAAPEELAAGRSRGHRRPLRDQPLGSRITDSRPESSRSRDRSVMGRPRSQPAVCFGLSSTRVCCGMAYDQTVWRHHCLAGVTTR